MNKPLIGLVVGGIVGAFDGLTALFSAPEVAPEITISSSGRPSRAWSWG